jgi:hypothetical protein
VGLSNYLIGCCYFRRMGLSNDLIECGYFRRVLSERFVKWADWLLLFPVGWSNALIACCYFRWVGQIIWLGVVISGFSWAATYVLQPSLKMPPKKVEKTFYAMPAVFCVYAVCLRYGPNDDNAAGTLWKLEFWSWRKNESHSTRFSWRHVSNWRTVLVAAPAVWLCVDILAWLV